LSNESQWVEPFLLLLQLKQFCVDSAHKFVEVYPPFFFDG
jgi:hypothetical protein